jgi:tetratricopeptide (TPR) repeat protein
MALLLAAVDVAGPLAWRWVLSDEETGAPLASHVVDLDPGSEEVAAFRDLYGFVRWRVAPYRRLIDQMKIVGTAGAWAGRALLGPDIGAAIVAEAPATVRVAVPAPLGHVLMWPLELAHADGRPLAARGDVPLVYDIVPGRAARRKNQVGDTLRMLAVFSQPTQTSVLALRQERYALTQLIRRIAARERAAVELRVVQYGVTRERLAEIADSGNGWDILHLAGHGGPGQFLLEHADGTPDLLVVDDLIELLHPARHQLKLAVVSACASAADTVAETLRLVGLADPQAAEAAGAKPEPSQAIAEVTGVARALVRDLECAVVAMRYPVTDEFAIALGAEFYEHLLVRGQPVDVAAARAVAKATGAWGTAMQQTLSLATPGVFGGTSEGLRIEVPTTRPLLDLAGQKMAHFPDEPERFVGRTAAMTRASATLAHGSGRTTVLLHGMAGSGKTACALELAYRHQDAFSVTAFWQAPTRPDEWASALADFANRMEIQLRDYQFAMAEHIGTATKLEAFLPRLRSLMQNNGLLLVLDNLETLLTPDGEWLDPRWELVITALAGHRGESRLVLTSQVAPTGLGPDNAVLPVHALSLDESAALARELPYLRGLLHAEEGPDAGEGPVRGVDAADIDADRERLRRVLRVVQGHPKLLEFADAAAADRDRLDAQLAAAEQAVNGQQLEAFFRDGTTVLRTGQFLDALAGWTTTALGVLPPEGRLMAEFLACLEDRDRLSNVVESTWAGLWRELDRPGNPPAPGPLLAELAAAALTEPERIPVTDVKDAHGPVAYRVHPGVAGAIAAATAPEVIKAADAVLAAFWRAVADQARDREQGEDSGLTVRAGLAASPYLLRRGDWITAGSLLEHAVIRDSSPGTVQAVLPALRRIAAATGTPETAAVLARALRGVDPAEAERLLRGALDTATRADNYQAALLASADLFILLEAAGRLSEALEITEQMDGYLRLAGLGSWTALANQGRRLRVLAVQGEHASVLAEVAAARARMASLPDHPAANDTAIPWNVRENILSTGRFSAVAVEDWPQCLELTAEIAASEQRRGAGAHEVAGTRFNGVGALIRLGRLAEASRVLADCQRVFEEHANIPVLAAVLSTRADLDDELGHRQAAADLGRAALRLSYAPPPPQPRDVAISHHNLAGYLWKLGVDPRGQRAHRLAAALIFRLAGLPHDLAHPIGSLTFESRYDGVGADLPSTVAAVVEAADLTEGVRLGDVLAVLQPDPRAVEAALAEIFRMAASPPEPAEP